jgi:hypothetical protein
LIPKYCIWINVRQSGIVEDYSPSTLLSPAGQYSVRLLLLEGLRFFSICLILPAELGPGVNQPLTEMST